MNEDKMNLLLEELQKQNASLKKQVAWTRICSLILIVLIVAAGAAVAVVAPRLADVGSRMNTLMDQTNQIVQKLDHVAGELEEADISGMLADVNLLVEDSQDTMGEALEKIQAIDIDTLNEAIDGLNAVVSPLAKLFGR